MFRLAIVLALVAVPFALVALSPTTVSGCTPTDLLRHSFEITTNSGLTPQGRGNVGYQARGSAPDDRYGTIHPWSAKDFQTPNGRFVQISRISVISDPANEHHNDLVVELLDRGDGLRAKPGIAQYPVRIVSKFGRQTVVWRRPSALAPSLGAVSSEAIYTRMSGTISDVWEPSQRIEIELRDLILAGAVVLNPDRAYRCIAWAS